MIETGVSQSSDYIFIVSRGSCIFKDVNEGCERADQHFSSVSESCSCGAERKRCGGEMRLGMALWSSGSERAELVRTW